MKAVRILAVMLDALGLLLAALLWRGDTSIPPNIGWPLVVVLFGSGLFLMGMEGRKYSRRNVDHDNPPPWA